MAAIMKFSVLWGVAPFSLVEIDRRFRSVTASIIMAIYLAMKAASISETSENLYHTTRHNIPQDYHLHMCCRENLKTPYFILLAMFRLM
jgi:hypothetical protein